MPKSPDTERFFPEPHEPRTLSDKEKIGFELHPAQFPSYEDNFSDVDIRTDAEGCPIEFPNLEEKQKIVAELEFEGARRLFMCYNLADLQRLFDSYIGSFRKNPDRAGKIKWHLYSWTEK